VHAGTTLPRGNCFHMQTTTAQKKLNGLNHLRALAIAMVFLFHYQVSIFGHPAWVEDVAAFGWTGVDLFFVLSGFLISCQLFVRIREGKPIVFGDFFMRRFFRIVPAYLAVVAIYFLLPLFREKEALPPLWKFVTFTQNLGLNLQLRGTFSHAWSLCVEEHFYLLLPLALMVLLRLNIWRRAWLLLPALLLLGFGARLYSWHALYLPHAAEPNAWMHWYKYIYYPTYNRLDGLMAGVSIAALHQFAPAAWARLARRGNVLLCCGMALLMAAYYVCCEPQAYIASIWGFPLVALAFGMAVAGAVSADSVLYKLQSRATGFVAALSYAIYLTHKGVIHVTQLLLGGLGCDKDSNGMLLACIISCVAVAWALHHAVERPFMRLRKRF
jgi:peptidoglycan/LPS O-acetylase OafA/YrhL